MKMFILALLVIMGCSIQNQKQHRNKPMDEFDKILAVMKTKDVEELYSQFGKPNKTTEAPNDKKIKILSYELNEDHSSIEAYLDQAKRTITHLTLFYWKDFDNYTALKGRFKNYKWIETKLADNPKSDAPTDLYLVKIPEIKMEFQYDNLAPQRKVMWIYFD